jgi:hypothetical protein
VLGVLPSKPKRGYNFLVRAPHAKIWIAVVTAACLAAGCGPSLQSGTGKAAKVAVPAVRPPTTAVLPPTTVVPPTTVQGPTPVPISVVAVPVTTQGGGVISNNSGNLSGTVKAPLGLISENGGGIISNNGSGIIANNGGSIIANNGGGYHLLALEQLPVAQAVVRLLDAAGNPIPGPDGRPLVTKTDAQGGYGFAATLPNQTVLVEVALDPGKGNLRAIAPRDAGAKRTVDLELVSTLTTAYILDQYVKGQPDPIKTLEKLPGAVEAQTRKLAGEAFAASGQAAPSTLATDKVVETVTALRSKAPAFNAQMETVKKLLIAAGLSDLGNGQPALDVFLDPIQQVIAAPDGSFYLNTVSRYLSVIWRVTPQQRLERLTAQGQPAAGDPTDGQAAADARFGVVKSMALDAQGRLWILQDGPSPRLLRLSSDRKTVNLVSTLPHILSFIPTTGDNFLAFVSDKFGAPTDLVEVLDGKAPRVLHTYAEPDNSIVQTAQQLGRDDQGRIYLSGLIGLSVIPKAYRLDATGGSLTFLKGAGQDNVSFVTVDPAGKLYFNRFGEELIHTILPDGKEGTIAGAGKLPFYATIVTSPDGANFVADGPNNASFYMLRNGVRTLYAGKEGQAPLTGVDPTKLSLNAPSGLVVAPGGEFYIVDDGAILKVDPLKGTSTVLAKGALLDGAKVLSPQLLRRAPNGDLYMIGADPTVIFNGSRPPLYRIAAGGGTPEKIFDPTNELQSYAFGPNGAIAISEIRGQGLDAHPSVVNLRTADGQLTTLLGEDQNFINQMEITYDAQGKLLILGSRKIGTDYLFNRTWRWSPGTEPELMPEAFPWPDATDAQGRIYEGFRFSHQALPGTLRRTDPKTGVLETLAGVGGLFFAGAGVDDGVSQPVAPGFDGQGNLYFLDKGHKQVKKIPANRL